MEPSVNILLVDDQPAKLLGYEAILSGLGENLIKAHSAREALDHLLRNEVAVVLIDVHMPELDGFELAEMIREHPRYRETAIIFVSAVQVTDFDRLRGYQSGAVDYVSVPVVPEILRAKVSVFADLYRKTKQLEALNVELEKLVAERTAQVETSRAQLRKSEERLELAIEGGGMATWDVDLRAGSAVWSESHFEMLGYPPNRSGEATLDMWLSRMHPSDGERVREGFERAVALRGSFAEDFRIIRADTGGVVWLSAFGRVLADATGEAARFVGICNDVSARKIEALRIATEHEIATALANADTLDAAAPALLYAVRHHLDAAVASLWLPDADEAALRCVLIHAEDDPSLARFVESSREYAVAPGAGLVGRVWRRCRPEAVEPSRAADFLRRQAAEQAGLRSGVAFPVLANGRCACVIEYFSRAPVSDGELLLHVLDSMASTLGQLVERKRVDAELHENRERLQLALDSAGAASWDWDVTSGRHDWTRFRELYGGPDESAPTLESWLARINAEDRDRVAERVKLLLETSTDDTWNEVFRIMHPTLGMRMLSRLGRAIRGESGRVVRVSGIDLDVTERVTAEEALKEADRRKDEFLATLSHELRNPLAPIRNALHLMSLEQLGAVERAESRQMIERQVEYMVRLVDDLLDVSRISSGKITLRSERLDIASVIMRAVEICSPLLDARAIVLSIETPETPIVVEGDLARLVQVVGNVLHNAAKYTDAGGRVSVIASRQGDAAEIRIEDTGIGIPPEILPHVFDLFTQARDTGHRTDGGLGIGLALARRLAEMHGGSIRAESAGAGRGSAFVLRIPMLDADAVVTTTPRAPTPTTIVVACRVLVADDNEDAADSMTMLLQARGHEVETVYDGIAALRAAENFRPDVAVLDIGMPGMDGYEVARRIRQSDWGLTMTLIAQTGWGQPEDRQRALDAGFDIHLTKPVDPQRLAAVLAEHTRDQG